jgi:hypothetical protein
VSCRVAHAYGKIGMGSRGVLPGPRRVAHGDDARPDVCAQGAGLIDAVMVEWAADPDACRRALRARRDAHVRWPKCSESGLAVFGVRSLVCIQWGPLASTPSPRHAIMRARMHALCGHVWPKTRGIWPFPAAPAHGPWGGLAGSGKICRCDEWMGERMGSDLRRLH